MGIVAAIWHATVGLVPSFQMRIDGGKADFEVDTVGVAPNS